MDKIYNIIDGNISFYLLCLMMISALFLLTLGIRRLMKKYYDGLLYLLVAVFLVSVHIFYLYNIPSDNELSYLIAQMNLWYWTVLILAPSLIILFIIFGVLDFLMNNYNVGAYNIFFGLSLLCFLFMLGGNWPIALKGIITFAFMVLYFKAESRPV